MWHPGTMQRLPGPHFLRLNVAGGLDRMEQIRGQARSEFSVVSHGLTNLHCPQATESCMQYFKKNCM